MVSGSGIEETCMRKRGRLLPETVIGYTNSAVSRQLGKLDLDTLNEFLSCTEVTSTTLITALLIIEKFRKLNPKPSLYHELTATELLILATMAASKFIHDSDDEGASWNCTWSSNFDIDLKMLNRLEIRFYSDLNWNLFVSQAEFDEFVRKHIDPDYNINVNSEPTKQRKYERHHPVSVAKRVFRVHSGLKEADIRPKWPMTRTMTVFAAAVLAISGSGLTPPYEKSSISSLMPNLSAGNFHPLPAHSFLPTRNSKPFQSLRFILPRALKHCINMTSTAGTTLTTNRDFPSIDFDNNPIPNGSSFSPLFDRAKRRSCATFSRTHRLFVGNPGVNSSIFEVGVR